MLRRTDLGRWRRRALGAAVVGVPGLAMLCVLACGSGTGVPDEGLPDGGREPDLGGESPDLGVDAGADQGVRDRCGLTCEAGCAFVEVVAGNDHTCARRDNGQVLCWGRNREGQLGDGRRRHPDECPPAGDDRAVDCSACAVVVSDLDDATQLSIGGGFTDFAQTSCALRSNGEVWCWGYETIAEGGGSTERRDEPRRDNVLEDVRQVSVSTAHLCMVAGDDRAAFCYGDNSRGQLGVAMPNDRLMPTPVDLDPSPDVVEPMTGVDELRAVRSGQYTCARRGTDLRCWGRNNAGQLGVTLTADDGFQCIEGVNEIDCTNVPTVITEAMPLALEDLGLGFQHVCGVDADGDVVCWGDNRAGQAGDGPNTKLPPAPVAGLSGPVADVEAGSRHTCALLVDGSVQCWGWNRDGQLGDGVESHGERCEIDGERGDCSEAPVAVRDASGPITDATHLTVGANHSCVLRGEEGDIWCWGLNRYRQLGDLTSSSSLAAVEAVGTQLP
ncbi:MAG: RCC1 domain-containing protein [Sandaracinaceae bacterium]